MGRIAPAQDDCQKMTRRVLRRCAGGAIAPSPSGTQVPSAGKPIADPNNLGKGWVTFDYEKAFGKRVKVINDAAMQALGSYRGKRMLFLGLGTGLGSALMVDGRLKPLELAQLPYRKGRTFEDYLGKAGLHRLGRKKWRDAVKDAVRRLRDAMQVDDVVLGGGNVKHSSDYERRAAGEEHECVRGGKICG